MVNGIRNATSDMFEKALGHDRVVIVAGGVGIVSYLSLIHALRLQAVMMMMSVLEDGANNDNGGVDYDESMTSNEAYNNEEDLEENGNNAIPNGSTATVAAASPHTTKRIDVHWMSRDEGLIQHVVQNYLVPFCSHHEGNTNAISIHVMVHHTSPSPSLDSSTSTGSPSNNNGAGIDGELTTTTWQPAQHHHVPSSMTTTSSIYEGKKPSPFQNILPSITLASILFGGLPIIHHCYENIQEKHVVETRSIAVVGILVLAMVVSLVSNGVGVLVMGGGGLFHSKFLLMFASYSKLENSSDGDDGGRNLDGGAIECGQVVVDADATGRSQHQLSKSNVDDTTAAVMNCSHDDDYSANHHCHSESPHYPQSSSSPALSKKASQAKVGKVNSDAIMSISHSHGRPDLSMIVRDAMMDEEQQQREADVDDDERSSSRDSNGSGNRGEDCRNGMMDLGIFMCGPTAMSNSVWNAIKIEDERERGLCKGCNAFGRKPVAVYQEVFEL